MILGKMRSQSSSLQNYTRLIFIGNKLLSSPLGAMYELLGFILCKELHATPLQITLLISLRPMVAFCSFYGSLIIKGRPDRFKIFIILAHVLAFLPCPLFLYVDNTWFFLLSYALFMMSVRAIIPAWLEILKIHFPPESRGKIFSQGATATYLINILIPLSVSPLIDYYPYIWRWIFFILALVYALSIILILFINLESDHISPNTYQPYQLTSIRAIFLEPWKNCWSLIRQSKDFRKFQIVFMLGGSGLMIIKPILPAFFKDTLQLSYTQLTLATSLCKGIGFALASSTWAYHINRVPIHLFNFYVTICAGIFTIFIMASEYQVYWIYIAYLMYGCMQAGSELSWNLSGPIFAQDKDSTFFTSVNVLMLGLRGCIVPFLGEFLFLNFNASVVFIFSGCLCLFASVYSLWVNWSFKTTKEKIA